MALTSCRECGGQVSDEASTCPNCGVDSPAGRGLLNREFSGCSGCAVIGVAVFIIVWVVGSLSDTDLTDNTTTRSTGTSSDYTSHVRRYVHGALNVRAGPGTEHEVVDQFSAGDMVYVDSRTDSWTVVYAGPGSTDTVGYVFGQLLEDWPLPDLQVVEHDFESGEYNSYITGRIRNNSNETYSYVQVSINLYDRQDNLIGSTLDNANNLRPGDTWSFRAIVTDESANAYRIEEVTGY